ncbi:hypothetical protein M2427_003224 [Bradyrhizobium sp. BR13661]|jgi:hypothetical protein|nr:hypothetical protein [Bradyrhizobium sp. BR13661]
MTGLLPCSSSASSARPELHALNEDTGDLAIVGVILESAR